MRLSISNIAWSPADEQAVCAHLTAHGVEGVEVAPTKIWPQPLEASVADIASVRSLWNGRGMTISSFQALLFGRPDLVLFGSEAKRVELLAYCRGIMQLAARLGAGPLVFGSPRNRLAGEMPRDTAFGIACEFFREAGKAAEELGVTLCVEPNPPQYGCDFINTHREGAEFVQAVGTPGCRLQLDGSSMILNGEEPEDTVATVAEHIGHVHISEPFLNVPGQHEAIHRRISAQLHKLGYAGWVTIEMRETAPVLDSVRHAVAFAKTVYFGESNAAGH